MTTEHQVSARRPRSRAGAKLCVQAKTCMRRGGEITLEIIGPHAQTGPIAFHRMTLRQAYELQRDLARAVRQVTDEITNGGQHEAKKGKR